MNMRLYPRLAVTGIVKNKRLYFPYILTCVGMIMMQYIINSLSYSPLLHEMPSGENVALFLSLGKVVIAVFALIFLFYTNSFLIRRRNKEFGLYNILGMNKGKIARVILWESLIVAGLGLVLGIVLGIGLSKFAELGLLNALKTQVDYSFTVSLESVLFTLEVFAVIFLLLFVKSLIQVYRSNPLELMHSESTGEKPPKANWLLAFLGITALAGAYYLAVTIKSPLTAIFMFFVAVIMVIIATYMLFTAGSVALCRILQKNKGYYYKKQRFVSVSSMKYRMKRNGAGLASICILSTMVLVMISSTTSLYIGAEDSINNQYPRDILFFLNLDEITGDRDAIIAETRTEFDSVLKENNAEPEDLLEYEYNAIAGLAEGDTIITDSEEAGDNLFNYDNLRQIFFISDDDYNSLYSDNISLSKNQAAVIPVRCEYEYDVMNIGNVSLNITDSNINKSASIQTSLMSAVPTIFVIVSDYSDIQPLADLKDSSGRNMLTSRWYYGYNLAADDEKKVDIFKSQEKALEEVLSKQPNAKSENNLYTGGCKPLEKNDFYTTFGSMFFLGIILSIVFIFATVLIIYYKQISEGYEDRARFDIMQKVGMTKRDIKKSVNSQILTVFFAPLIFAGMHLAFAFPLIWKLLQLFSLQNLTLVIIVTISAFLVFCLFYALVYKLTAQSYYRIVSSDDNE